MKILLTLMVTAGLFLTSCTIVTSTNVPGKQVDAFPKKMLGKYEIVYPGEFAALNEGEVKSYVTIEKKRITTTTTDGETTSALGDSLYLTKVGKQYYLSLGASPSISVFRLTRNGKDIELYPLFCMEGTDGAALQPYFSSVEEVPGQPDENGEYGPATFEVTIDESKLDAFYKSGLPYKEPFVLKRMKS